MVSSNNPKDGTLRLPSQVLSHPLSIFLCIRAQNHRCTYVWLSVQPTWLQRGGKIAFAVAGEEEAVDSLKVAVNYLSLPLLAKIVSGNGKTYVTGGIDLGFVLDATLSGTSDAEDISDTFKPIDLSAVFAFGVMLPIGRPRLTLELRYSQSIINVASLEQDPELYSLPPRFRWSGLQLFAGFLYPLGGGS